MPIVPWPYKGRDWLKSCYLIKLAFTTPAMVLCMTLDILWFMVYKPVVLFAHIKERIRAAETFIAAHPWPVLGLVLLLTLLAGGLASRLVLFTSRKAMFPQNTPELVRMNAFLQKFKGGSNLVVVMNDAPLPVLKRFATRFAARLRKQPEISEAIERIDLDFFEKHAFLLVPTSVLKEIGKWVPKGVKPVRVHSVITKKQAMDRVEAWLRDPPDIPIENVDMGAIHQGMQRAAFFIKQWITTVKGHGKVRIPWAELTGNPGLECFLSGDGYFMTHDHKMLIMLVNPSNPSGEIQVLNAFVNRVRTVGNALRKEFAKEHEKVPGFGLTGLPVIEYEAHTAVRNDIFMIVTTAGVLVLLLVVFGMRSWRRALVVFVPMGVGSVWNAGLTLFTIGHLTEITSGFTAVLFGMGVDYGIFMSSRIAEEVAKGADLPVAIGRGAAAAAKAIFTAGGATTLIFASLNFVEFKGFAEMGMVAATGVALVILATFTVLPALYAVLYAGKAVKMPEKKQKKLAHNLETRRFPVLSWGVVVLALGLAGWGLWKGLKIPFDYNSMSLLPKHSEASKFQKILVENSDFQPEIVIFTASTMAQARRITKQARACPQLANVESISDLFPPDMGFRVNLAERLGKQVAASGVSEILNRQKKVDLTTADAKRLAKILKLASDMVEDLEDQAFSSGKKAMVADLEHLNGLLKDLQTLAQRDPKRFARRSAALFNLMLGSARRVAGILSGWAHAKPLQVKDLPASIRNHFFSRDGHEIAVYAYPRKSVYVMQNLKELLKAVYAISPRATGFPTTNLVFSQMANRSLRQGSLWALLIVLLWILVNVRNFKGFWVALVPLLIGESWMMGLMVLLGIKFNYANIITIPLVMALAVDYGVWFVHRRAELADMSAWSVSIVAARSIMLAAGTTLAGLGAVTLANYRGIASMGLCLTIGVASCIVAALVVAPALDSVLRKKI